MIQDNGGDQMHTGETVPGVEDMSPEYQLGNTIAERVRHHLRGEPVITATYNVHLVENDVHSVERVIAIKWDEKTPQQRLQDRLIRQGENRSLADLAMTVYPSIADEDVRYDVVMRATATVPQAGQQGFYEENVNVLLLPRDGAYALEMEGYCVYPGADEPDAQPYIVGTANYFQEMSPSSRNASTYFLTRNNAKAYGFGEVSTNEEIQSRLLLFSELAGALQYGLWDQQFSVQQALYTPYNAEQPKLLLDDTPQARVLNASLIDSFAGRINRVIDTSVRVFPHVTRDVLQQRAFSYERDQATQIPYTPQQGR